MSENDKIVRERQRAVRREMMRRGITVKAVQLDGGWENPSTVLSHFPNPDGDQEPHTMSLATLNRLIDSKALPLELLSMLLPDGMIIVKAPESVDYDTIADWAETFNSCKLAAHRADSECKEQIGPGEKQALDSHIVAFPGRAA